TCRACTPAPPRPPRRPPATEATARFTMRSAGPAHAAGPSRPPESLPMRALLLSLTLLLAAVALPARAQAALPGLTEGVQYRYIEGGEPYRPLPPGMVEVAEVFAYWCPHCAHFAPMLDEW